MVISVLILLAGLGDSIGYKKDSCTSRAIRSIDSRVEIVEDVGDYFNLDFKYNVKFRLGSKRGSERKMVSKYLFTRGFIHDLRLSGSYETTSFKVDHVNMVDDCDNIKVTKFDDKGSVIEAKICPDVPVLGITNMKYVGRFNGSRMTVCLKEK